MIFGRRVSRLWTVEISQLDADVPRAHSNSGGGEKGGHILEMPYVEFEEPDLMALQPGDFASCGVF